MSGKLGGTAGKREEQMSKRKRRQRDEARPAYGNAEATGFGPASVNPEEPQLVLSGPAFAEFEEILEAQLDALVNRWAHLAAPSASRISRAFSKESRRTSEQA
jgi:hypothetical protein